MSYQIGAHAALQQITLMCSEWALGVHLVFISCRDGLDSLSMIEGLLCSTPASLISGAYRQVMAYAIVTDSHCPL